MGLRGQFRGIIVQNPAVQACVRIDITEAEENVGEAIPTDLVLVDFPVPLCRLCIAENDEISLTGLFRRRIVRIVRRFLVAVGKFIGRCA